ncbi:hypothetical protein DZF79_03180 [Vibrio parahaemolyticus]|nr:hypothetical protein [Vibrio parahaemolyticus]
MTENQDNTDCISDKEFFSMYSEVTDSDGMSLPMPLLNRCYQPFFIDIDGNIPKTLKQGFNAYNASTNTTGNSIWGVNPKLKCPQVFYKDTVGQELDRIKDQHIDDMFHNSDKQVVYIGDEFDFVPFSRKNLERLYGFPKLDAKRFFDAFNKLPFKFMLAIPVEGRNKVDVQVLVQLPKASLVGMTAFWGDKRVDTSFDFSSFDFPISGKKMELGEFIDWSESPLDIVRLPYSTWADITKEWLKEEKSIDHRDLSIKAFKRHVVNMIRHCSIGYHHWWKLAPKEQASENHDKAFDLVMRAIWAQYPSLQEEVKNQLNNRSDDPNYTY